MTVPTRAIRSRETVPASILNNVPETMTIHGLLAAAFLLNPPAESWRRLIPERKDFDTFPFFWPKAAQELLPAEAKRLVITQQSNFDQDWKNIASGFPEISLEGYEYAWFVVGTRSFYYETPQTILYPWHDRLALLPIADLFNHAEIGCQVSHSAEEGYKVTADRAYGKGSEVCTSYGDHSNDFLLAEFGFLLRNNAHDQVYLDQLLLPKLDAERRGFLEQRKRLGAFLLKPSSRPCPRTVIALCLVCAPATDWKDIVDGKKSSKSTLTAANKLLQGILEAFLVEITAHRRKVTALDNASDVCRTLLAERWDQIDKLVRKAVQLTISNNAIQ